MDRQRVVQSTVLTAVIVLAAALRFGGVTFGFPLIVHPDEPRIANAALQVASSGQLHPGMLHYPSFLVYANAALFAAMRTLCGWFGNGAPGLTTYYLGGRILTLSLSILTLLVCASIGRRFGGAIAGLVAALLVGASFLHAKNSFFITTDVPMALWTTVALGASLRIVSGKPAALSIYLVAGAAVGFAAGTKYTGFLAGVSVALAHLLSRPAGRNRVMDARIWLSGFTAVAAFLATTPYAALDFSLFRDSLDLQRHAYTDGHPGAESVSTSYGFYAAALWAGVGAGTFALSLFGLLRALPNNWRRAAVLAAFPVALFGFMGAYSVRFDRNLVAIVPPLAIFAGLGAQALFDSAHALTLRHSRFHAAATLLVCVWLAAAVVPQALAVRRLTAELSLPDTRWLAKQWIDENLPARSRIAREFYTPPPDPERFEVTELSYYGVAKVDLADYDYVITSSKDYDRFLDDPKRYPAQYSAYQRVFRHAFLVHRVTPEPDVSSGPEIRIYTTRHPADADRLASP